MNPINGEIRKLLETNGPLSAVDLRVMLSSDLTTCRLSGLLRRLRQDGILDCSNTPSGRMWFVRRRPA